MSSFSADQLAEINRLVEAATNATKASCAADVATLQGTVDSNAFSMDQAWLVLGGALVFFMHSGFALLEVGSVSIRNVQNILFKNAISPTFAAVAFWFCGYTFAFGQHGDSESDDYAAFIGTKDGWFLAGDYMFEPSTAGMPYNSNQYASWFFQWAFAATCSTIVSGAVAERVNFTVYMIITIVLTAFIYPVVVHWQWGGGWAGTRGVLDFAGSGVVHMCGGVAALVSAIFVGPRHGRYVTQYEYPAGSDQWYCEAKELPLPAQFRVGWCKIDFGTTWTGKAEAVKGQIWTKIPNKELRPEKEAEEAEVVKALSAMVGTKSASVRRFANILPASSPPFQTLGCFILWFGWYGFNCGSTLGISGDFGGQAAKVAVVTTVGAAGGAIASGLVTLFVDGVWDLAALSNGILAGLVAITAPCALIEPWAGLVIGAIGGIVFFLATLLLEKVGVDDVVLAIPVHLFCGFWGTISVGLFTSPLNADAAFGADTCGIFYGCDNGGNQLWDQLLFTIAIVAWVGGTMTVLLGVTQLVGIPMAYSIDAQVEGMDKKHDRASKVGLSPKSSPKKGEVPPPVNA